MAQPQQGDIIGLDHILEFYNSKSEELNSKQKELALKADELNNLIKLFNEGATDIDPVELEKKRLYVEKLSFDFKSVNKMLNELADALDVATKCLDNI